MSLTVHMVLKIGGQLISIIAHVATMVDEFLAGIGLRSSLSCLFATITSYIFYPVAWLMGVPPTDSLSVGQLTGTKKPRRPDHCEQFMGFYAGDSIRGNSDKAATLPHMLCSPVC